MQGKSLLSPHFFSGQLVEPFINPRCTGLRRWLETHSAGKLSHLTLERLVFVVPVQVARVQRAQTASAQTRAESRQVLSKPSLVPCVLACRGLSS